MTGLGTITVYCEGTGATTYAKTTSAPTNAVTYIVPVDIAEGTDWAAATDIPLGTYLIQKRAMENFTWPTAAAVTYGATLSTSTLTGGSMELGSFAWTDGTTIPAVVNSGYSVTLTISRVIKE